MTYRVSEWTPWRQWRADAASNLFATDASWEWFSRRHRRALIESGQWIPRQGRGGALVGPEIDRVVLEIMRREAAARGDAAA